MATSTTTKKAYTVFTPAGKIYCDHASEAKRYKDDYGYVYTKTPDYYD
jgi:hypothetical protein